VYFEYICWKFAGRFLDRVNGISLAGMQKMTGSDDWSEGNSSLQLVRSMSDASYVAVND